MEQNRCYGCMKLKTSRPRCEHCGYSETANNLPHQLPVGTVLNGQYIVGRVLGQGGFGITYLGWDDNLDRPVAIKEYFPQTLVNREIAHSATVNVTTAGDFFAEGRDKFLREAKTLAKLQNVPEIARIYNFFAANNTAYIIMEYVDGVTLQQYVRQKGGRLSPEETLGILRPVIQALARVHKTGLVHRDISPDNIMLEREGQVRLLDFGTARPTSNEVNGLATHSTQAVLKYGFAPIEQYQTRGNLGPWTDEYALCATAYCCMTGQVPPEATSRITGEADCRWREIPGLPSHQAEVLEKGMAILSHGRFPDLEALGEALYAPAEAIVPQPVILPPPVQYSTQSDTAVQLAETQPIYRTGTRSKVQEKTIKNQRHDAVPINKPKKKQPGRKAAVAVCLALVLLGLSVWGGINRTERDEPHYLLMTDECSPEVCGDCGRHTVFGTPLFRDEIASVIFLSSWDQALAYESKAAMGVSRVQSATGLAQSGRASAGVYSLSARYWTWPTEATVPIETTVPTEPTVPIETTVPTEPFATTSPTNPPVTSRPTNPPVTSRPTNPPATSRPTNPPATSKPTEPPVSSTSTDSSESGESTGYTEGPTSTQDTTEREDTWITGRGWDISANGDGSIVAWAERNSENSDLYDLYIASDGIIDAPVSCSGLFSGYVNVTEIQFGVCFDTSNTISMQNMFRGCGYLTELNLSSFNVKKVDNVEGIFEGCSSLRAENLDAPLALKEALRASKS